MPSPDIFASIQTAHRLPAGIPQMRSMEGMLCSVEKALPQLRSLCSAFRATTGCFSARNVLCFAEDRRTSTKPKGSVRKRVIRRRYGGDSALSSVRAFSFRKRERGRAFPVGGVQTGGYAAQGVPHAALPGHQPEARPKPEPERLAQYPEGAGRTRPRSGQPPP